MDADWLASQLAAGRSIESIARETGRSSSTVGYWVNKHGLTSRHAPKHAARGGVDRSELEAMVARGMPIRAMAEQLGVSHTTVRHWLKRYGLTTPRARRLAETAEARATGAGTTEGYCSQHGLVPFVRRGPDGFRASSAAARRSTAGGGRSSASSSTRPAVLAYCAATRARPQRSTSTTSIRPPSRSDSAWPD